jgi:signal transduction histidine kinase
MSIRLRFTLLYNAILAVTLVVFGVSLYTIQARTTMDSLKRDLARSSEALGGSLVRITISFPLHDQMQYHVPPVPFENFSDEPAFKKLPEREIVRVLDANGQLVASPFGAAEDALPLSSDGLAALSRGLEWWEISTLDERLLIYSQPIMAGEKLQFILQIARPLTERDRTLKALGSTLVFASLVTLAIAFGIGWILSGITIKPIHRITQTAQEIGAARDFKQRVNYSGPQDEVGQLATTFNEMLSRLDEGYQRVAHSLTMQRNFVADVSHELRTPLTTLRGNLGLLRRTPPIPVAEQADILTDMVDESDRMIRLVNDLLVLARADAGRNLARDQINLSPVLEEVWRQARQLDPARSILLDVPPELILPGDRDAFKQIALILVDNALKHSTGPVEITARRQDGQVVAQVEDHGAGLPPEKLAHVFDRFYRSDDATTPGFGLGLSIAKALVEGLGGTIEMESELGRGSLVRLKFSAPNQPDPAG